MLAADKLETNWENEYIIVNSGYNDSSDHQKPVSEWYVYLTVEYFRCMDRLDLREI
jgi:hypothetical protein